MTSRTLEFRVLSGLQVGARIRLPDGVYTVGCGLECDIVIQGQNVQRLHLTLKVEGDEVTLTPHTGDCNTTEGPIAGDFTLELGQPFNAATIWLQVTYPDAPWPAANELVVKPPTVEEPVASEASDPVEPEEVPALDDVEPVAAPSTDTAAPEKKRSFARKGVAVLSVGMLATLFFGAVAVAIVKPEAPYTPTEQGASNSAAAPESEEAACITRVLRKLELTGKIRVAIASNNQPVAQGFVPNDNDLTALANILATRCPNTKLEVRSEEAMMAQAKVVLERHAQHWALQSFKDGRMTLLQQASGGAGFSTVHDELVRSVSGLVSVHQAIPGPAEVKRDLQTQLGQLGIAQSFTLTLTGDRLQVSGNPTDAELAQWNTVFAKLQQKYNAPLPLTVKFDHKQRRTLPFRIHQVVAGPMPFVVLDDGSRLYEGGEYENYRLVSVKEHQLVFGGPETVEIAW